MTTHPAADAETPDPFRSFFETSLRTVIPRVLAGRRRGDVLAALAGVAVLAGSFGLFTLVPALFATPDSKGSNWFSMALFAVALGAIAGRLVFVRRREAQGLVFRNRVIRPIAAFVDPGLDYAADRQVDRGTIEDSLIFDKVRQRDRFVGAGLFSGRHGDCRYAFSALTAERTTKQGCHLRHGVLFGGLFLEVAACRRLDGFVLIVPTVSGITGEIVAYRLRDRGQALPEKLAVTGVPAFDKVFSVFVSDRKAADGFLTPELIWRLMEIRSECQAYPYLSRMGERLYLALLTGQDHFCMPRNGEALDLAKCEEYRRDMAMGVKLAAEFCACAAHEGTPGVA